MPYQIFVRSTYNTPQIRHANHRGAGTFLATGTCVPGTYKPQKPAETRGKQAGTHQVPNQTPTWKQAENRVPELSPAFLKNEFQDQHEQHSGCGRRCTIRSGGVGVSFDPSSSAHHVLSLYVRLRPRHAWHVSLLTVAASQSQAGSQRQQCQARHAPDRRGILADHPADSAGQPVSPDHESVNEHPHIPTITTDPC